MKKIETLLKTEAGRLYLAVRLLSENKMITDFTISSNELCLQKDEYGLEVFKDDRAASLASTFDVRPSDINKVMSVFVRELEKEREIQE